MDYMNRIYSFDVFNVCGTLKDSIRCSRIGRDVAEQRPQKLYFWQNAILADLSSLEEASDGRPMAEFKLPV